MVETKKERLDQILRELNAVGGIEGSAVISRDGLLIASGLSESVDAGTFAAMSAAMVGAAETASSELKRGELNQIIVDAQNGKIIAVGAGVLAILVCLLKSEVNLGLVLLEMGRTTGKISDILKK